MELGSRYPGGLAALVDTDEAGDLVLRGDQLDEILWADAPPDRGHGPSDAALAGDAVFPRNAPKGRVAGDTIHLCRRSVRPGLPPTAPRRDGIAGVDRHRVGHEPLPAAVPSRPCRRPARPLRRWLAPKADPACAPGAPRRKEGPQTRMVACEFESRRALRLQQPLDRETPLPCGVCAYLQAFRAPSAMCGCDRATPRKHG